MWLTDRDRRAWAAAILAAFLTSAIAAGPAWGEPAATRIAPLALNGFDPVSYALPGGPAPGSARFELAWGGRSWRFASESDRAAFRADPDVYAPRLGGFDAMGILDGRLVDADPTVFALIGSRLYLFRNAERRARALADPGLAREAEAIWPSLRRLTDGLAE